MKTSLLATVLFVILSSCQDSRNETEALRRKTDSLSTALNQMKPGLGEYMLSVQLHHNKLWYAADARNWDLADFEIAEIREQFAHTLRVNTDRVEIKSLPMIEPFIDSLGQSVKNKDITRFHRNFVNLTDACNDCHKAVHFDFIRIKTPDQPMFTNQKW